MIDPINPLHILVAIVVLCVVTMIGTLVLLLTGNDDHVAVVLGFTGPIIGTLMTYKAYLIHQANSRGRVFLQRQIDEMTQRLSDIKEGKT